VKILVACYRTKIANPSYYKSIKMLNLFRV
jgi:hypothetical protein